MNVLCDGIVIVVAGCRCWYEYVVIEVVMLRMKVVV